MPWPADLDPGLLRQPDRRSCGAACVVAARAVLAGDRPQDHAAEEIRGVHRLLTSTRSTRDRLQMPWPRALGTPPWAIANALTALTGERIATVNVRPRPAIGYQVLHEQVRSRPVAVYLGSRWLPRHVVLAVEALDDGVEVFDPASGRRIRVPDLNWGSHRVGVAGWTHFWFVV